MKNPLSGSKETTIAGLFAGISLIAGQLYNLFDKDATTLFDVTTVIAAVSMIIGFWRARDQNKSSEMVGIK